MAKRDSSLNSTAESIGVALGQVAARLDKWKADRASISADIQKVLGAAQTMLSDLGDAALTGVRRGRRGEAEFVAAPPPPRNKGGRPKGYKMSAATKAKLRAAWKRRKGAVTRAKAGAGAARAGAKAFVKGKKAGGGPT
jgi:hypothetical protein